MIAQLKRGTGLLIGRPAARLALQAIVSLTLVAILVIVARRSNMLESLRAIRPETLAFAAGLQAIAYVINSFRWQLLLHNAGVRERLGNLVMLYFIGQFFSLFLPTGAGGDAVRIYDVARRSGRSTQTIVATLQERLVGLGASLLIGLVATLYYLPLMPPELRGWAIVIQVVGMLGATLLIYPAPLFAAVRWCWRTQGHRPLLRRAVEHPLVARVVGALRPIAELPPLRPLRFCLLVALAVTAISLGMGAYYVLGRSLQIGVGFTVLCMVVPLVWITRMAPVSLNGLGVSEGAFVFLMGLFGVPSGKTLALALAFFGTQTALALLGGLLLLVRMARGTWVRPAQQPVAD